jgi:hypothetical protein
MAVVKSSEVGAAETPRHVGYGNLAVLQIFEKDASFSKFVYSVEYKPKTQGLHLHLPFSVISTKMN